MYNILYEPGNIVYLRRLPLFLPRVFFTRLDRFVRRELPRRLRPPRPKNPRPSSPFFSGAAGAAGAAGAGTTFGGAGTTFGGAGGLAGAFVGGADIYLD